MSRRTMGRGILATCLAALAFCTPAQAVTFTSMQYDVTAVAGATGAAAGFDTRSSPSLATPVSASADSIGTTDLATAGAIGGPGLLSTSADVSASAGIGSATATSHFFGSFVNTGALALSIDYTPFSFASGSGLASTSLFVMLTSNGVTLFSDYLTAGRAFAFAAAVGTTGSLDLTLTSDVSAAFLSTAAGDASSAAQVTFLSPIPEPGTWALFAVGLGGLFVAVRSGATRRHPR